MSVAPDTILIAIVFIFYGIFWYIFPESTYNSRMQERIWLCDNSKERDERTKKFAKIIIIIGIILIIMGLFGLHILDFFRPYSSYR